MELTASTLIDELARNVFNSTNCSTVLFAKHEGKALRMELQRCYSIMTAVIPPSLHLQHYCMRLSALYLPEYSYYH